MTTTKRATLPGADELFRSTGMVKPEQRQEPQPAAPSPQETQPHQAQPTKRPSTTQRFIDKDSKLQVPKSVSGRQRHEEKVTFYCTREELLALERARLVLREHGVGADRGRIVREALSYTLADLDANGPASILADRLGRRR